MGCIVGDKDVVEEVKRSREVAADGAAIGCRVTEWVVVAEAGGVDREVETCRWLSTPIRLPKWAGSASGSGRLLLQDERGGGGSGTPLRETSSSSGASAWKGAAGGEDMLSLYGDGTCSLP